MKRKPLKKITNRWLHLLQHILIVVAAVAVLIVFTGSSVMLKGVDGNYSYRMDAGEKGREYEDSLLFNYIFGRGISDVARMTAVRSQMETDGHFDGSKEIDVAAYFYRYEGLPDQYVTAKYRLEDLIKWGQYGFEYKEYHFTMEEAEEFLGGSSIYTWIDNSTGELKGGIVTPFNSQMEEYAREYSVSANELEQNGRYRGDARISVLANRYQTVEGKNIEEYTAVWEDYTDLCRYVMDTARDLASNYEEYLRYKEYYDINSSNLRYYIEKRVGGRQEVYTNLRSGSWRENGIREVFEGYGRYLYFNPGDMTYDTDTLIQEQTVRHVFNAFEYAYPETMSVWIGVDTTFPAEDVYVQGYEGYSGYVPCYRQLVGLAGICIGLYLILFVYLTIQEGRETDEEGKPVIRLKPIDHIPTEITVLGAILLVGGSIVALVYVFSSMSYEYYYRLWFKVAGGAVVLICELLFTGMYYSLVRRLKGNSLWRDSLTCRAIEMGRNAAWRVYDNGDLLIKTWIPYGGFMALNLILILLHWRGVFPGGIPAAAMDLAVGMLIYRNARDRQRIVKGIEKIREGDLQYKVDETNLHGDNIVLARAVNSIGEGIRIAVETSMKDERLKTDLITNVSHDIKTPLTSIINYVDLVKRENIENEKVRGYVEVLDAKSQRLKQLTDDLVEASKISSGNISLQWERINLVELINQTLGEFSEKFGQKSLKPIFNAADDRMYIEADSRRIWRVAENLFNNIFKYALEGTRVYLDMKRVSGREDGESVQLSIKNISAQPLNIDAEELTERFIRGDLARSTEGSGLGLSIAKNLTEAQKGRFEIRLDGDLFKVILTFPILEEQSMQNKGE
ncbi:MAG: HAMP domain-containing histidine kinase [Lachnospiraceae bacterium]|nr:HAMP domain-containing histidine kinase [Lachnospiraceae bacterium]